VPTEAVGLLNCVAAIDAFAYTDDTVLTDRPSSQLTIHLNGILTPATSR
jgi:hypothetical protein